MVWQSQDMCYIPCAGQLLQVPEWPLLACFCVCVPFPTSLNPMKNLPMRQTGNRTSCLASRVLMQTDGIYDASPFTLCPC